MRLRAFWNNPLNKVLSICLVTFLGIFFIGHFLQPEYTKRIDFLLSVCGMRGNCLATQLSSMGLLRAVPYLSNVTLIGGIATVIVLFWANANGAGKIKLTGVQLRKTTALLGVTFAISTILIVASFIMLKTYAPIIQPREKCRMAGWMDCTTRYTQKHEWKLNNTARVLEVGTTMWGVSAVYLLGAMYLFRKTQSENKHGDT